MTQTANDNDLIDQVKIHLLNGIVDDYRSFSNSIARLPLQPNVKNIVFQYLDTAYLWIKEGFHSMEINIPEKKPETEVVSEMTDSTIITQDAK
jgi:hypothetical protein